MTSNSTTGSGDNGSGGKPVTVRMAERICAFREEHLTAKALAEARTAIIDTVACTLSGIPEPCVQILLNTPGVAEAAGPSLIFGTNRRTSALDAALINGVASHALDFDDVSGILGGHHSVTVCGPIFALGEQLRISGRRAIAAYVIGVETAIRLARGVNFHHYDKGWHPTATLGVFGATAASCWLLKLDAQRTARALALAASFGSGLKANFGTMTKPMHVGHMARNGLFAALVAERGFEANPEVMEHKQGWFRVYNGEGTYHPEKIFEGWGAPWEIEASENNGLKQFACCGSTHPAITMALRLVKEEGVTADQVAAIEILAHKRRLPHTDNPNPTTPLQAKFSIQYAVARALADGAVKIKDFEGDAIMDERVRRLLPLIKTGPHPDMPEDSPKQFGSEVIVTMKDGRRLSRRVDHLVCRGGDYPMTSDELFEKFEDCGSRVLAHDQLMPLFERLETLDKAPDLAQVTALLEPRLRPHEVAERLAAAKPSGSGATVDARWVP